VSGKATEGGAPVSGLTLSVLRGLNATKLTKAGAAKTSTTGGYSFAGKAREEGDDLLPGEWLGHGAGLHHNGLRKPADALCPRRLRQRDAVAVERQERRRQAEQVGESQRSGRATNLHGLTSIRIGTCSWADEALSKYFYPPKAAGEGTPRVLRRVLRHGGGRLDVLPPTERVDGAGLADRTPDGFTMHVKAFGLMTRHPVKIE